MGGEYGTALATAVHEREEEIVLLLVDRGADMNSVTDEFGTVLGQAIYKGTTEMVSLFLEHGANVEHVGGS